MSGWDWSNDGWIILAGVLSACSCALVGNFLVLRKMSLMGDAISHAVLPGLAIAFILSGSRASLEMFVGAVLAGTLTAVLSQAVVKYGGVERGAAMGVVFSVLFALGLILIRQAADHVDLDPGCVLYGNIVQIPLDAIGGEIPPAIVNLAIVFGVNLLFVGLFYKELRISTFDPQLSTTLGIPASLMHYLLMILVSMTTVANFESVGSILVIAMLIVPGVAAHLLTDRLSTMIILSLVIASASAVLGHIAAAFGPRWVGIDADTNTSAMMAVVAGMFLLTAVLASPQHGVIGKAFHRVQLSLTITREDILGLLHRWREMSAGDSRPMHREEILAAVGDSTLSRWALRSLVRRRELVPAVSDAATTSPAYLLTPDGVASASVLVRSHRLWESYLAKHFAIPLDHLHMSAERWEHFITPQLREELSQDLTAPDVDPHGKEIPPEHGGQER
ncbi:hypothetical protein B7486_08190 [cyanobacterium TDX16]|nr:hypothetical protein B7486_08190 [cyanobacterium TDX16]